MKTVRLTTDFDYVPDRRISIHFVAGKTYRRVLDAAAQAIERAEAGRIVADTDAAGSIDASHVWRRRRRP